MAAKTTAKDSSLPRTRACRAIWVARVLAGSPAPEKIGSFCPRTRVLRPSIAEIPVWIKSDGSAREQGLIGLPTIVRRSAGTTGGASSIGSPTPLKILPRRPGLRSREGPSSVKTTLVPLTSRPTVSSRTWTTTWSAEISRTCPRRRPVFSRERMITISPIVQW